MCLILGGSFYSPRCIAKREGRRQTPAYESHAGEEEVISWTAQHIRSRGLKISCEANTYGLVVAARSASHYALEDLQKAFQSCAEANWQLISG
ncbi:MAG: hypothetical protein NTZ94_11785 [Verrucomicrobia bacterium]|nr:hypothetical protein [Verrucomicrobiota bacterium]